MMKNSQSEAEDEAVLPDHTRPTQLQNWVVARPILFSICGIYLCEQRKGIENKNSTILQIVSM